jgi:hypothetical protein
MALFVRVLLVSLVALTIVYACLLFYGRARQTEKLEEAWLAAGQPHPRAEHVDEKLETYTTGLRRKLIWGVYVVPLCGISVFMYLSNFA